MKKLFALLTMIAVLFFSSIAFAGDPEVKKRSMKDALTGYLQHFDVEKSNIAVEMSGEIYDYFDSVDVNDFYISKARTQEILNGTFPILDKYKTKLPLMYVDFFVLVNSKTCNVDVMTIFNYTQFNVKAISHVHKIQGITPKCPQKEPDAII